VQSAAHGLSIKAPPFKLAPVSAVFVRPNLSPQVTTVSESLAAMQNQSRSECTIVQLRRAPQGLVAPLLVHCGHEACSTPHHNVTVAGHADWTTEQEGHHFSIGPNGIGVVFPQAKSS